MIAMLRQKGKSLNEISQLITDECCTDYNCKDNVTLIIIDLKKHYNDFQKQVREQIIDEGLQTGTNFPKRYNSCVRLDDPNQ